MGSEDFLKGGGPVAIVKDLLDRIGEKKVILVVCMCVEGCCMCV